VGPTAAGRGGYLPDGGLRATVVAAAIAGYGEQRARRLLADLREFNDAIERAHAD
jgi:hypothetical protein